MVCRKHRPHLKQLARNEEDVNKEKKKEEEQVAIAEVVQRLSEVSAQVVNSPPSSAYAKGIALAETNEVALLKKKNYKVSVSIGLRTSHMNLLTCLTDTGAGANLIRSDLLEASSKNHIRSREVQSVQYRHLQILDIWNNDGPP